MTKFTATETNTNSTPPDFAGSKSGTPAASISMDAMLHAARPRGYGIDARLQADSSEVAASLSFQTRDTYMAWVMTWKTTWKTTVENTRRARSVMRDGAAPEHKRSIAQSDRARLRIIGANLLVLRSAGKQEAARQWAATRNIARV